MSLSSRLFSRLSLPLRLALPAALSLAFALPLQAQTAAAPAPDIIYFTNGDQLTGKLSNEVNGKVTFHSDIAGDVTVTWDKIKSIKTSQQFAVIQQGQHVNRKTAKAEIAQGNVAGAGRPGQGHAHWRSRRQRHSCEGRAIHGRPEPLTTRKCCTTPASFTAGTAE